VSSLAHRSIGFGAASILLEAGAKIIIISSSQANVDNAVTRLGGPNDRLRGLAGNVRDENAFADLLLSLAPLDHIVFSGVDKIIRGELVDTDLDEAKRLFGVKFWGSVVVGKGNCDSLDSLLVLLTNQFISALAKHDIVVPGGSLTLTSGAAAIRPKKGATIGSALNSGVITLTAALADELTAKKIRVNTVVPGLVKSELWDKLGHTKERQEEMFEEGSKKLPVGFVATPDDIAEAYLYLVRASYANGSVVVIGKSPLLVYPLESCN